METLKNYSGEIFFITMGLVFTALILTAVIFGDISRFAFTF